ncbi:SLAM family member 5-like [Channa argus]|uniref:SLAM family member 5-like n=1 Tax=Channa argus TaxID=215402 RepID=UPI003520EFBC
MSFILVLGLLVCIQVQESVSDAVSHVFVLKGNDLLLNVNQTFELNEETEFQWKFNTKIRIAKLTNEKKDTIFDPYKGRAELFKENYSLLLKNLQQSDSGDYAAVLSEGTETTITEHKVTVEEPVSPVKLTVISSSSDPCNITVTCSTVDSLITKTYRCDKQTCSYQGGEEATANYDSINVTVQEGFIICNHSNHVSWKNDTMDIKTYCGSKSDNAAGLFFCLVKTVVFSIGLTVMVSAVISVHLMETFKKNKRRTNEETTHEQIQIQ